MEEYKMKYTQEIKDKAVQAAQEGKSLKEIQQTIGPNPKATQRYLLKAGIDYKELRVTLRDSGKLKPSVNLNKSAKAMLTSKLDANSFSKNKKNSAKANKIPKLTPNPVTTVVDE